MGYVERSLKPARHALQLGLLGPADAEAYDVDFVGMDDGLDRRPDATFRVVLQLGQGYMIYLYVVAAVQPDSPHSWFHSFWTKDCAVAHVDMEEHGPPRHVRCAPLVLPRLHDTFVLEAPSGERRYSIGEVSFSAHVDDGAAGLEVRFELTDEQARPCELSWSSVAGWRFHELRDWRALVAGERVTFR